jgi:RNA polymerase sigma-70 factor (ECF subfamily)
MSRGRPQLQLLAPLAGQSEVELDGDLRASVFPLVPGEVFRRHARYVAAVAHRLLGRDDDVDDTVQDVFVIAVRGIWRLRDAGAIRAWLASITVRVARRRLRMRRARHLLGIGEACSYENVASESATPEQKALLATVYQVLDSMPADERIAWTLHHVEGETLEAVASLCNCSLATAKRRIRRAALTLQEAFGE